MCKVTSNTHLTKIASQHLSSKSSFLTKCVELFDFGYVSLNDPFFCLDFDRTLNNGATLVILSTPSRGLACLRCLPRSSRSTAPPHHSSIQQGIAGSTQVAQTRSRIGGNVGGTYLGTSRISCTARFHTARGEEIVPTYLIITGSKKTTALTMRITAALPRGAKSRHTTHG